MCQMTSKLTREHAVSYMTRVSISTICTATPLLFGATFSCITALQQLRRSSGVLQQHQSTCAMQRLRCSMAVAMLSCITALLWQKSGVIAGVQALPPYLSPGPSANSFNSTDNHIHDISCHQIKLHTREGPPPAWFQQAAMDPSSYNFAFCTCAGSFHLQVSAAPLFAISFAVI